MWPQIWLIDWLIVSYSGVSCQRQETCGYSLSMMWLRSMLESVVNSTVFFHFPFISLLFSVYLPPAAAAAATGPSPPGTLTVASNGKRMKLHWGRVRVGQGIRCMLKCLEKRAFESLVDVGWCNVRSQLALCRCCCHWEGSEQDIGGNNFKQKKLNKKQNTKSRVQNKRSRLTSSSCVVR